MKATLKVDVEVEKGDLFDEVRRRLRESGNLPGLGSGTWFGPIYVTHPEGYPFLIMP